MSTPLTELLGTEDLDEPALAAHVQALRGQSGVYEYEWQGRMYSVHVEPLRGPTGNIEGSVGAAIDITDRKRAERALVRREAQLAEAQRMAHVGSWERDVVTGRLTWSDELYRIFGLEPQAIPASFEAFLAHVHPDDAPRVRAISPRRPRPRRPRPTMPRA